MPAGRVVVCWCWHQHQHQQNTTLGGTCPELSGWSCRGKAFHTARTCSLSLTFQWNISIRPRACWNKEPIKMSAIRSISEAFNWKLITTDHAGHRVLLHSDIKLSPPDWVALQFTFIISKLYEAWTSRDPQIHTYSKWRFSKRDGCVVLIPMKQDARQWPAKFQTAFRNKLHWAWTFFILLRQRFAQWWAQRLLEPVLCAVHLLLAFKRLIIVVLSAMSEQQTWNW